MGDVKESLSALLPFVNSNAHPQWISQFNELYQVEYEQVIKGELYPEKEGLTMGEVLKLINEVSGNNAVIVSDVGQHQMIACRYAKFNETKSNITSGGLGTMGFALPAAIGAKWERQNER